MNGELAGATEVLLSLLKLQGHGEGGVYCFYVIVHFQEFHLIHVSTCTSLPSLQSNLSISSGTLQCFFVLVLHLFISPKMSVNVHKGNRENYYQYYANVILGDRICG